MKYLFFVCLLFCLLFPNISFPYQDISTEIDEAFETAYREWYDEKFEEYQNELINDGYELHEDHK